MSTRLVINGGKKRFSKQTHHLDYFDNEIEDSLRQTLLSKKFFRYSDNNTVALLEQEIAESFGVKYAITTNSCGSAMFIALKCLDIQPGDRVLVPSFTFTAVPSAVIHANGIPIFIDTDDNYTVIIEDLRKKIVDAKVLLMSYMRGHISNMDEVLALCQEHKVALIEDCAHAYGNKWRENWVGTLGDIGCFSTQTNKLIKSGEGGFILTNDDDYAAKAIIYAGCYETWWKTHLAVPTNIEQYINSLPSYSMRMTNVAAALLRPQISMTYLQPKIDKYNYHYTLLCDWLSRSPYIHIPQKLRHAYRVNDSLQFQLVNFDVSQIPFFLELCEMEGISVKYFAGSDGARCYTNWRYINEIVHCPNTSRVLKRTFDLFLPLELDEQDILILGEVLLDIVQYVFQSQALTDAANNTTELESKSLNAV